MKLKQLFEQKKERLLNIYFTAGFPQLEDTGRILKLLEANGVDMVEIGIPYSDPISDGVTIQGSNSIALCNGITLEKIFEQVRLANSAIPKIMMGYFNSVVQYGVEKFCKDCQSADISAVILPDLPLDIFERDYKQLFDSYDISFVALVTPQTSEKRIREIDSISDSFIYAVSSASTTGQNKSIRDAESYLQYLQGLELENPVFVGFNIKTNEDLSFVWEYAQGGIIGSAFINQIKDGDNLDKQVKEFLNGLLEPVEIQ